MNGGGSEREGDTETETGLQAPSWQHRARRGARTHGPWDHDPSRSRALNRLSHPGAPYNILNQAWYVFLSGRSFIPYFSYRKVIKTLTLPFDCPRTVFLVSPQGIVRLAQKSYILSCSPIPQPTHLYQYIPRSVQHIPCFVLCPAVCHLRLQSLRYRHKALQNITLASEFLLVRPQHSQHQLGHIQIQDFPASTPNLILFLSNRIHCHTKLSPLTIPLHVLDICQYCSLLVSVLLLPPTNPICLFPCGSNSDLQPKWSFPRSLVLFSGFWVGVLSTHFLGHLFIHLYVVFLTYIFQFSPILFP